MDDWKLVKGSPEGTAGLNCPRSNKLASSLRFGSRQSVCWLPPLLVSLQLYVPALIPATKSKACCQETCPSPTTLPRAGNPASYVTTLSSTVTPSTRGRSSAAAAGVTATTCSSAAGPLHRI